jgi:hypothetical protein
MSSAERVSPRWPMLSNRLVERIEDHSEQIITRTITQIRRTPELAQTQKLPDAEFQEWAQDVLRDLDAWLCDPANHALAKRYESLGRLRFEESVPLSEVVFSTYILKNKVIEFARSQGFGANSVEIYAEDELENRLGRFFDWLVYHAVRGYEGTPRRHSSGARKATNNFFAILGFSERPGPAGQDAGSLTDPATATNHPKDAGKHSRRILRGR